LHEPAMVVELRNGGFGGCNAFGGGKHPVAIPIVDEGLVRSRIDVEDVVEPDQGSAVESCFRSGQLAGAELVLRLLRQHVFDPGERACDPLIGSVEEFWSGKGATRRGEVTLSEHGEGRSTGEDEWHSVGNLAWR